MNTVVFVMQTMPVCLPKKNVVCLGKESTNETLLCRFVNDFFIKRRNEIESPIKEEVSRIIKKSMKS